MTTTSFPFAVRPVALALFTSLALVGCGTSPAPVSVAPVTTGSVEASGLFGYSKTEIAVIKSALAYITDPSVGGHFIVDKVLTVRVEPGAGIRTFSCKIRLVYPGTTASPNRNKTYDCLFRGTIDTDTNTVLRIELP